VVDGDDATAAQHNTPLLDLQTDANTVRPIVAGGTGGSSASAARTALGLGTIATQGAGAVAITGGTITGSTIEATAIGGTTAAAGAFTSASASSAPTDAAHLTRKDYVDANVSTFFIVQETQADGTNGGTFTQDAWRTRALNTTQANTISGASLASNQVTLPAGTYRINGHAAAYGVSYHQARLYNITASATLLIGKKARSLNIQSGSEVVGLLTLGATTVIELQHYASYSQSEYGFGNAGGTGWGERNLYAYLEIEKIS
jgi:hypothetical protein